MIVIDVFGILMFIGFLYFAFTIIVVAGELFDFLMRPFRNIKSKVFKPDETVNRIMEKLSLGDEIKAINETLKSIRK